MVTWRATVLEQGSIPCASTRFVGAGLGLRPRPAIIPNGEIVRPRPTVQRTMANRIACSLAGLALALGAWAGPDTDAFIPAQAAADVLRSATGTDAAFLAAGMIDADLDLANLASMLRYPTDTVVVVSLKGSQIRQALERSVSLYPSPNTGFLQLSGMSATFSRAAAPDRRIVSVTVGDARLDEGRTYTVAMPSSLGRGGLGYFKVWQASQARPVLEGQTLESLLKGKRSVESAPRWIAQ